ncbi:MAG: tetratricopeptide repeat protein [Cyanobacteriota bacterium]|nr:tetratricopeptide repeat protein [Cyanobacteriota bacterium]
MSKLAILKINVGDFDDGFSATARIEENDLCIYEGTHRLPPAPHLPGLYQNWKSISRDFPLRASSDLVEAPSWHKSNFRALRALPQQTTNCSIDRLAEELENGFNEWLNSLKLGVQQIREGLLDNLSETEDIRFFIETKNETLSRLPWERWDLLERYENSDVILSFADRPMSRTPVKLKEKVKKILVILGESSDINVQADLQLLQDRLPPDAEILEPLIATSREEVYLALWDEKFDILFFAGHGSTDFGNGRGKFQINDTESLTVADLKEGLKQAIANGLKLAIFNSCDGIGLARDLIDLQMEAIVVMRENTPDEVAQRFLEFFLQAFATEGKSLSAAVTDAKKRLKLLEDRYPCASWLPVLCQHPEAEVLTWEGLREVKKKRQKRKELSAQAKLYLTSVLQRFQPKSSTELLYCSVSLLTLVFLTLASSLPNLAVVANNYGLKSYQKRDLSKARAALNLATKLDGNNSVAPYNLGRICEKLQDFECAEQKYKISLDLQFYPAYSQLGSLYIKQKQYKEAVELLNYSLVNYIVSSQNFEEKKDYNIEYALHKNLGWALLKQGRDEEALFHLQEAIKLDSDRAPARCLSAQVLDRLGDDKAAVEEWEMCLKKAKVENPDEAIWIGMALQRLQAVDEPWGNEKTVQLCKTKNGTFLCPS